MLLACGFESLQAHQTNMIRTYFQSVMGSDYCFSLTATKAPTSATGGGASPPPSREGHGRRKQPHKRKKGGRSRLHGAPRALECGCGGPEQSPNTGNAAIQVLGSGCAKCHALEELGVDVPIEHVTDFTRIAAYGVMSTPALVVQESVVSYGKMLSKEEAKALLQGLKEGL